MKYSESHEWIEVKEGTGVIGVSHHAQQELGEIVYVELPKVGKDVKAGEEACVLESTKAAADVYSPVSGTILEVNSALVQTPNLINESPEDKGWLFKIRLSSPQEMDRLMEASEYLAKFKG